MRRSVVAVVLGFAASVCGVRAAQAAPRPSPCTSLGAEARHTVIVFRPPSSFTICRDGEDEDDVVTGRRVYLQLQETPGARMFDFRVHGQETEWTPTGLSTWETQTTKIVAILRELEHSGEPIADIPVPLEPPPQSPLRALAAARTRYLGDVTTRFSEGLHAARGEVRELPVIASVVRRWCAELTGETADTVTPELKAHCSGPELQEGAVDAEVTAFEAATQRFGTERDRARDLLVGALAKPDDAAGVTQATEALDHGRAAAQSTLAASHALRESGASLAKDLGVLRVAFRSMGTLRPGVATYLTTYGSAGNAELEIDAVPVDIAGTIDKATANKNTGKTVARYPVIGRHFLDLEAGFGVTSGLPNVPFVGSVGNVATIQSKPVDEFVGLALVELEPLRFLWPDRPAAGLLRLPVLGVPFTRDPTQNFFFGGGIGWTGVGSLVAGPYLLRELTLRDGFSDNEALPNGTTIQAATVPALRVGYFVSASVDLLGLFHVFFPGHGDAIEGASGKEK